MKTEKEKMKAGEWFKAADAELNAEREKARALLAELNGNPAPSGERAARLRRELMPLSSPRFLIRPPFHCDYGYNIRCGEGVYINFNCVILDVAPVIIGRNTLLGPAVQIYAVTHPTDADHRRTGDERGLPVSIGRDCWIGGGAVICPGVTIGDRCVIGAGAVVTRDVPSDSMAVGNPARVVKKL